MWARAFEELSKGGELTVPNIEPLQNNRERFGMHGKLIVAQEKSTMTQPNA
jgi:hypothetical protein